MYKIRTFRTHESTNAVTFMETGEDEEGGKRLPPSSSFSLPKPPVALSLSLSLFRLWYFSQTEFLFAFEITPR